MRIKLGLCFAAIVGSMALTACGSSSSSQNTPTPTASALEQWNASYAFLASQSKPTEIFCSWLTDSGNKPAPRPALFYDFSDRDAWKTHLLTRNDPTPKGIFEECQATVPTTVPYGPDIETFLKPLGLSFAADPDRPAGLAPIEIAYAGQDPSDPDIIYRDEPGLFGLDIALHQIGGSPFEPGTSKIIKPTDEETAVTYLKYAKPLLDWYGYRG